MRVSNKDWHGIDLNSDQLPVLELLREFCETEIRPAGPRYHKLGETPWDIIKKGAKRGPYSPEFLLQMFADKTGLTAALGIEELFSADAGIALAMFGTGLPAFSILKNGTPEQIAEWLPKCFGTEDDPAVAAFGCTEPDSGSDIGTMRTTAVYNAADDTWTLNGSKMWITNGGIADVHVIIARVDREVEGSRGQASFIIPPGTPGLTQDPKHDKIGFRASHTAPLNLDNVVVPGACLLGGKERLDKRLAKAKQGGSAGGQAAMSTFEGTRWMVAAMGVGIARAAYEYALKYALERKQFGKSIAEHQQIATMLADMDTDIYHARLGVIDAARTYLTTGELKRAQGSKVKKFATELAVRATRDAIQILGAAGYVSDHPVGQWHNDALLLTIFEGTTQIQNLVIASNATGKKIR